MLHFLGVNAAEFVVVMKGWEARRRRSIARLGEREGDDDDDDASGIIISCMYSARKCSV